MWKKIYESEPHVNDIISKLEITPTEGISFDIKHLAELDTIIVSIQWFFFKFDQEQCDLLLEKCTY